MAKAMLPLHRRMSKANRVIEPVSPT